MPDTKISALSATTTGTPASDLLEVVQDIATVPVNYKITWHNFLLACQPNVYIRVYNNANISIADATPTAVTFNSERNDAYGFHSTSVNPSRLTVPAGYAGLYAMLWGVQFDGNVTGTRNVYFLLNGTTNIGSVIRWPKTATLNPSYIASTLYWLAESDYIEGCVYHTVGAALDVLSAANHSPELTMMRLGRSP